MKKRKHLRMAIESLSIDVADGIGFYRGMVSDVSRLGICMTDLPKRLNGDVKIMTIVISDKEKHFKMQVRPRWYTHGGIRISVGAEIINAPCDWTQFVEDLEPVLEKNVWAEIRI